MTDKCLVYGCDEDRFGSYPYCRKHFLEAKTYPAPEIRVMSHKIGCKAEHTRMQVSDDTMAFTCHDCNSSATFGIEDFLSKVKYGKMPASIAQYVFIHHTFNGNIQKQFTEICRKRGVLTYEYEWCNSLVSNMHSTIRKFGGRHAKEMLESVQDFIDFLDLCVDNAEIGFCEDCCR